MRITSITGYRQDQPFRDGPYICSGGRSALGFDSIICAIATDAGITGWGEMAPLGAFYDPAFAAGARAAFAELAPALIGQDPTQIGALDRRMDHLLKGHPYAKAALDMACWDILGKKAGLPLAELLGGRYGREVDLYRSVPQEKPERMVARAKAYVAEGYRRIQVKVGLDPDEDIERLTAVREALGGVHRALRRCQLRLDHPSGPPLPARDPRPRLLHGAALRHLCRMPGAARRLRPAAGARRIDRQPRGSAPGPCRRGRRCHHHQAGAGRRHRPGAAHPRHRRRARHRRDGGGYRRGRDRHRGDDPYVALHAGGAAPPHLRLPQLGHPLQCAPAFRRAGTAASAWATRRVWGSSRW